MIRTSILVLTSFLAVAQPDPQYGPGHYHSKKSSGLLERLNLQRKSELDRNRIRSWEGVNEAYRQRTSALEKMVRDSLFLNNSAMNRLMEDTFERLQKGNAGLTKTPKSVLVERNPFSNAVCPGEGTFYVTTGLLAQIKSQSQLASVLAHELAHYELNHMKEKIALVYEAVKKAQARTKLAAKGKEVSAKEVIDLRERFYDMTALTRKGELEADSLGFIYLRNAGFRQSDAVTVLEILDPEDSLRGEPAYAFLEPLNFSRYPFQPGWLKERASVYERPTSEFFMPADKLQTHPELIARAEKLLPGIKRKGEMNFIHESTIQQCAWEALVESAAVAYRANYLDIAVYWSLVGLRRYPTNKYLVSLIGRSLVKISKASKDRMIYTCVPLSTAGYPFQVRQVNNIFYNMDPGEIAEMGYHFMSQPSNFSEELEEHYLLLAQLCDLSGKSEVKKRVASSYLNKFPKGKYRKMIR